MPHSKEIVYAYLCQALTILIRSEEIVHAYLCQELTLVYDTDNILILYNWLSRTKQY